MKKVAGGSRIIERLHKSLVLVCIGVTIYGTGHLGLRWYRYFAIHRPEQKRRELLEQKALLAEGSPEYPDKAST